MAEIVLTTLNARYSHTSLALRYLHANLGPARPNAVIREFVIQDRPAEIAEAILALEPRLVGLGVYIWNAAPTLEIVRILRQVRPELCIVLGGPEVSHEVDAQELTSLADHVITGEGETELARLCAAVLQGERPEKKVIPGGLPDLTTLQSPYPLYSDRDLEEGRVVYVEASRGCPFSCEFCLSSLDVKVRQFPLDRFLGDLAELYRRGVRHFRFIDRTFNLKISAAQRILDFFLERLTEDSFIHFEMVPDRLPAALRDVVARFPAGALQFEVGIQTFDDATAARIGRRHDANAIRDNLRWLRRETGVHVHADLIAGLPGEGLESFARGFDELIALEPQEIQVGILKRLRGTPIARHTDSHRMVYSAAPPYEVLQTADVSFEQLQRLKRFARAWDLVANSGNFRDSLPLLWQDGSPFAAFLAFSDWLYQEIGAFTGIALPRLAELWFRYLCDERGAHRGTVAERLAGDYVRPGRSLPTFLAQHLDAPPARGQLPAGIPKRQARHLA